MNNSFIIEKRGSEYVVFTGHKAPVYFSTDEDMLSFLGASALKSLSAVIDLGSAEDNYSLAERLIQIGYLRLFALYERREESFVLSHTHPSGSLCWIDPVFEEAIAFHLEHPITEELRPFTDTSRGVINRNTNISIVLLGFSRANFEYLTSSLIHDRYLVDSDDGVRALPINYYIVGDKSSSGYGELRATLERFRYLNGLGSCLEPEYLPLPDILENITILDDSELSSLDFLLHREASHILRLILDPSACNIREDRLSTLAMSANTAFCRDICCSYPFISLKMWNAKYITEAVSSGLYRMAAARIALYNIERANCVSDTELALTSDDIWRFIVLSPKERAANLSSVAAVCARLNLMGFSLVPATDKSASASGEDYLSVYSEGDPLIYEQGNDRSAFRKVVYTLDFPHSLRRTLAELEHLRWCAFTFCRGYMPSTRAQIASEMENGRYTNGRSDTELRHGNLCSFDAMREFSRIVAERDGVSELERDVIKYDYQLMDYLLVLLRIAGMKIVRL